MLSFMSNSRGNGDGEEREHHHEIYSPYVRVYHTASVAGVGACP